MAPRAVSPAISEQGFDISQALLAEGADSDGEDLGFETSPVGPNKRRKTAHAASEEENSDDDATFIAAQQAALNRKQAADKSKPGKRSGGFQSLGLNAQLMKAITRKGFQVPTPIQRKTIPLLLDGQDVVGMARTGSGKTAAFVIPMIERLRMHSVKVGARAIVLSPSRELALQTLKAVKEFGRGTDLRTILIVGGETLDEQFSQMTSNPDIIIATPGRFLHLLEEMRLDLSSIRYMVFDEADRLFEMGFSVQLNEILFKLPPMRQTMLFSATLPKLLVEFAKAGLKDPSLVRLDAETKVSPDLENAFFMIKSAEKDGCLLHLINDVIKIPPATTVKKSDKSKDSKKRKHKPDVNSIQDLPTTHSTIVFASTKHHVEYLASMLRTCGFAVSYVYGSLDQTARKMQVEQFRNGETNLLVVTDVAARGIDIPMLANVINYDFPSQPKVFVHRVGRTARAGRKGWSYNLVQDSDLPYLLDLQLFLGKNLVTGRKSESPQFARDLVLGSPRRTDLEKSCEWVSKLLDEDEDVKNLRQVANKGEHMYLRSRNSASAESVRRSKQLTADGALHETHLLYTEDAEDQSVGQREDMLARISGFRPAETVFEVGHRGAADDATETIRRTRKRIHAKQEKQSGTANQDEAAKAADSESVDVKEIYHPEKDESDDVGMDEVSEDELEVTFPGSRDAKGRAEADGSSWQDTEHFMSYRPRTVNAAEDRGYGVHSGGTSANFVDAARGAVLDLGNDESRGFAEASKPRMRWDKSSKKFVSRDNDEDGSKGRKLVNGESGQKIAASFRSGRFDAWRKSNKMERMPKTGEAEKPRLQQPTRAGPGRKFQHFAERAPKRPDKYRDDFYKQSKKVAAAKEKAGADLGKGSYGARSELKGAEDVRKARLVQQKRREKNARPSRKSKKM